jgi:alkanesulfonate monooxygenase SsuD/methylene tetrahydromethanopterin reductase-like flavin-dependent oxidoreductase (luciferase family)
MRLDLFYDFAVPDFAGVTDRDVYHGALDQIALADDAGFAGVWVVEHHFFREYSHCPAPEVIFGAISQRTKRMRIGYGVVILPLKHPVLVAEQIAALDLLSDGRIDVGVGRGVSPLEYEVFGASMEESRARVDESLTIMRKCWAPEPFAFEGQFWSFPEIDVVPKPLQSPHPPLWTAAVSPESFLMAADKGLNVLGGPFKPLFMVGEDRENFFARCAELGRPPGELGFGAILGVIVLDDHARAREIASRNLRWFYEQLLRLTSKLLTQSGESYQYYRDHLATMRGLTRRTPSLEALEAAAMVIAGSPDYAIERFRELADDGLDHVLCALGVGGIPHTDVIRSIELLGETVIPALSGSTQAPAPSEPGRP